jgi:hypothetical protein
VHSSVRDAVTAAAAVDRSGWSGAARSAEVVELLAARERLDALVTAVVGAWDAEQAWALDGSLSPVAWLAHRCPLTRQDASTLVRTARHVAANGQTAKALDGGDITSAHVGIAAQAAKHREDLYAQHEDVILDAARSLPPAGFRSVMQHWRSCCDDVEDHDDARTQIDRNYLDINPTFQGVGHLDGRLDPVLTVSMIRVLDRMEPPDPFDGITPPRTLAQRRADALARLISGDRPPRVTIDVILDVDTLAGRAPSDLLEHCCELAGSGPVSPALARTLACDAAIGRILMQGTSEVIDVGRRTRLVTPSQRRALDIRDGGCVEPGCTAPAHWCDGHHIVHWTHHGPTELPNLELRCRRHHLLQHQRDLDPRLRRRE